MRLLLASRHMRSSIRSSTATSSNRLVASSSLRSTTINSSRSSSSHVSQSSSSSTGVAVRGILGQRPTQQGSGRLFLLDSQTPTRVSRTALGVELCSSALTLFSEGGVRAAEPNMLRGWDIGVDDDGG